MTSTKHKRKRHKFSIKICEKHLQLVRERLGYNVPLVSKANSMLSYTHRWPDVADVKAIHCAQVMHDTESSSVHYIGRGPWIN